MGEAKAGAAITARPRCKSRCSGPEPAPIVSGVRRSHCGLGDGVPLRARFSARLITDFHRASRRAKP